MECCQKLHPQRPQLVVFTEHRLFLVREMLAVEVCEPTCPAPAENHINFEEPAVKDEEQKGNKLLRSNRTETDTKREFGQIPAQEFGQIFL